MPKHENLSRRRFLTASGGVATAAAIAGCSSQEPDDGGADDGGADDGTDDDGTGDGTDDGDDGESQITNVQKAQDAWERAVNNPGPDEEQIRSEAYVEIEEARQDDMIMLPLYHGLSERFWYDWVDIEPMGPLGAHHQQYDEVEIDTDHDQKDDNVLQVLNSTVSTLDPIEATDTASSELIAQVYETLTAYPAGVAELENQLLEEVELSDDLTTYTFSIRQDVEFHDGTDLTADDFKYGIRRLIEAPSSRRASFALNQPDGLGIAAETDEDEGVGPSNVVPDSAAIEVIDDHTLEIELTGPNPAALEVLSYDSFAAVPEGTVDDLTDYDGEVTQEEFSTEFMNGTGPFEFDEWVPESEARVTPFDAYYEGSPNVDAVEWTILEDDNAIQTVYEERNVDVFAMPTPFYDPGLVDADEDDRGRDVGTYGPLDNGDNVNYVGVSDLSTFYVGFNGRQTNRAARQAIAYLTDHEELVDQVFKSRGTPAFSFLPVDMWPEEAISYDDWLDQYPYGVNSTNRDEAREVLDDAGYTTDDPYELTITTYASEVFQEFGRLTRDKADGIGLDITLEEAEFSTLLSRGQDGDLQAFSLGWIWSWTDPAYGMYGFEPANTNTDRIPTEANGYYLDWEAVDE